MKDATTSPARRSACRSPRRRVAAWSSAALAVALACTLVPAAASAADTSATATASAALKVNPALRKLLPAAIIKAGKVRVASDMPFPPYEYTENGRLTGMEYELGQDLGQLLGVKFVFMNQPLAGVIPGLAANKYDIAMSAMADIAARRKQVDMLDTFQAAQGWLIRKGNPDKIKTPSDLCGKPIAVSQGGYSVIIVQELNKLCARRKLPAAKALTYSTQSATYLAVKSGKAATTVNDGGALLYLAKTVDKGNTYGAVLMHGITPPAYFAAAVSKAPALSGMAVALKKATQYLIDHGQYKALLKKYGLSFMALNRIRINGKL